MSTAALTSTPSDRAPVAALPPAPPAAPARPLYQDLLRGFRKELVWVFIFGAVANLMMLTPTLYMMQVFDRVMLSGNEYTLAALSLIALVFFLTMGVADWLRSRLLVRAGNRMDAVLQPDVFRASFEASLAAIGRTPNQAFTDLTALRQFATGNGIFALVDAPWTVVFIGVLFLMHPWLGWLALAFAVIMVAVAVVGNRWITGAHEKVQTLQMQSTNYLAGKLRNAESAHAMGMIPSLRQHWLAAFEPLDREHATAVDKTARLQAVTKFIQLSQQSAILALAAVLAIDGRISVGAMIVCNALMGNALRPISLFVGSWKMAVEARAAYRRLASLFNEFPPRQTLDAASEPQGQISLRGLTATAPGRAEPILHGLDAEFRAGEVIGIVGASGAGKSTLARCLVGIWPDTQGQVLLDGQPLQRWPREELGPLLGYLPQDIELMDGTIAENIARFGSASAQTVIEAATRTGIHDMVLRMPKGYDTPMGDGGGSLSGGQRQRIGLARAILGQPRLVVLDEPNASLDDAGEAALVRTVRELKARGTTVFMIVHQPAVLAAADRVLVLDKGRIAQLAPVAQGQPAATPTQTALVPKQP